MLVVAILPAERHREKPPPQLTFLVSNTKLIKFILTPFGKFSLLLQLPLGNNGYYRRRMALRSFGFPAGVP